MIDFILLGWGSKPRQTKTNNNRIQWCTWIPPQCCKYKWEAWDFLYWDTPLFWK